MCVMKDGNVVGHVPREKSRACSSFLINGGCITCEIVGHRKFGKGLEVPCIYKLTGKEKAVQKAKEKLSKKKATQ